MHFIYSTQEEYLFSPKFLIEICYTPALLICYVFYNQKSVKK